MNKKDLITKLAELELKRNFYKRQVDINFFSYDLRTKYFNLLKNNEKEIKKVKFMLKTLREINNEKSRKDI